MECKICGKRPSEIRTYLLMAKEYEMTPEDYVREEEGTFNKNTEKFYCDTCYISIGMPLGTA